MNNKIVYVVLGYKPRHESHDCSSLLPGKNSQGQSRERDHNQSLNGSQVLKWQRPKQLVFLGQSNREEEALDTLGL